MQLIALSSKTEIQASFRTLRRALTRGIRPIRRVVGWRGGNDAFNVHWLPGEDVWCVLEPTFAENRYWCAFGVGDPNESRSLTITCEINSPYEGVDRRMAGAFVRGAGSQIALAHSGKIGGGRKGIGQSSFLAQCRCAVTPVAFDDARQFDMVVIGALNSAKFRAEVGFFVREVQRVKALLVADGLPSVKRERFTPEFFGKKQRYSLDATVESVATHGLVVEALAATLEQAGRRPRNDRLRDLYLGPTTRPTHLFEVKTDTSTSSVYTAVGQLMVHGGRKRIIVVPHGLRENVSDRLTTLGIRVLRYRWKGKRPILGRVSTVL